MPLMFVQGILMPRFTVAMAGVMLIGREFYRFGYLDKDGPSSTIRELGAVPLNAAGFLLINSLAFFVLKRQIGGFFTRRKFVRYFTTTHYDKRMEKVVKEHDWAAKGIQVGKKEPTLLPMHPSIMLDMAAKLRQAEDAAKTPEQRSREKARNVLPDIGHNS